jgi:hypothetical protein
MGLLALAEAIDERIGQHRGECLGIDLRWFPRRDGGLLADGIEPRWSEASASGTPESARMATSACPHALALVHGL